MNQKRWYQNEDLWDKLDDLLDVMVKVLQIAACVAGILLLVLLSVFVVGGIVAVIPMIGH